MNSPGLAGCGCLILIGIFVIALCKAAAQGDETMEGR